jgi:hypothetical protein
MEAPEKALACGLCTRVVPDAEIASGAARTFQGVLYCSACGKDAEKARRETVALKSLWGLFGKSRDGSTRKPAVTTTAHGRSRNANPREVAFQVRSR